MDITDEFNAYYQEKLRQAVQLPAWISSRYAVEACLTAGDEKEVYLLTSLETGERCILRKLPNSRAEANRGEYSLLNALDHPRIPKAVEFYEEDGFSYLIRTYIEGTSLQQLVQNRSAVTQCEAMSITLQLCDILVYLHSRRPPVIHRDIKPQNIVVDLNGCVYLIDFDIARKYNPDAALDTTYSGTSATAPPEQFGYAQTDVRSDLYSFGILMIYLYTGSYERKALRQMPRSLFKIAETCTQFSPRDRYASAEQVRKALRSLLRETPRKVAIGATAVLCAASLFCAGLLLLGSVPASVENLLAPPSFVSSPSLASEQSTATPPEKDGVYTFASKEIEKLVRKKLGKNESELVTRSELMTIRELYLIGVPEENVMVPFEMYGEQGYKNGKPITRGFVKTLADISQMKNLTHLTLGYQSIVDLSPLKDLQLRQLTLPGNAVSDLSPLSNMRTLENLELYSNPVCDLSPIANLKAASEDSDWIKPLYPTCRPCNTSPVWITLASVVSPARISPPSSPFPTLRVSQCTVALRLTSKRLPATRTSKNLPLGTVELQVLTRSAICPT